MSGPNLTEGGGKHPPSAAPGEKCPVLLGLNQISNFSSNSQMAFYLESLSSMVHFPFNHVKEFELSHNCAERQIKAWGRFFSTVT